MALKYKCLILIALAVPAPLCAAEAGASSGGPLTLPQCIEQARKRSELLLIQSERQAGARERLGQARGALMPGIRLGYTQAYRDSQDKSRTISGGEGADTRLSLRQSLFDGFRRGNTIALYEADLAGAQLEWKNAGRDVAAAVVQAFYAVVLAEADRKNVDDIYALLRERGRELGERIKLGKSRESEMLMVESQIAALNAQGGKLDGDRSKALETLAYLTGIDPARLEVADAAPADLPAEPVEAAVEAARSRSDVQVARKAVESASRRVAIAKGALLPTLDLEASWHPARSGYLSGGKWDGSLLLDVPLFQGGILRSRVNEEQSRSREFEQNRILVARQAVTEVRTLHAALVSSLAQAAALEDAYAKANRSYAMQMKDYRFGLVNNLDVLQALSALLEAKRSFDRALIQAKMDRALLAIATEQR